MKHVKPRAGRSVVRTMAITTELGAQAGDVILFHSDAIIGRLIRFFDGSDWNHAGHLVGPDQLVEIDAGVPISEKSLRTKLSTYGAKSYAGVYRLDSAIGGTLTDFQPLMDSSDVLVKQAPSYGYDAIILLFLLSIVTKAPEVPLWGKALLTLLGKKAAGLLLDLEGNGVKPLICSALVYEAFTTVKREQPLFDIALPGIGLGLMAVTGRAVTLVPERGSVLDAHLASRAIASQPGFRAMHLTVDRRPTDAQIAAAGRTFLHLAEGKQPKTAPSASTVLVENPELQRSIETVLQFFPVQRSHRGLLMAVTGGEARLVSPGDLSRSTSLKRVGTLHPNGTYTPATPGTALAAVTTTVRRSAARSGKRARRRS